MARTTTAKRESESGLQNRSRKRRKTDNNASDSPVAEEYSSDGLFVQREAVTAKYIKKSSIKPARKPELAPRVRKTDEYEEDAGRTESQQFLALVEFESKKKSRATKEATVYMDNFTKGVDREQQKLKKQLQELGAASTKKDTDFLEVFKAAYGSARIFITPPAEEAGQPKDKASAGGFVAMYKKSQELTDVARALVNKFEEVEKKIEDLDATGLIENSWGEQDEIVKDILEKGMEIGLQKYRGMLTGSEEQIGLDRDRWEAEDILFEGGKDKVEGVWGKVAKKQEKSLRKLVRILDLPVA